MTVQKDSPTKVVLTFSGQATTAGEQTLTIDSQAFAEAYNNVEVKIDVKAQPTGTVTAALKRGGPLKKDDASTNAVVILTIESDSGLAFSDELSAEQFTLSGGSTGTLAASASTTPPTGTLTLTFSSAPKDNPATYYVDFYYTSGGKWAESGTHTAVTVNFKDQTPDLTRASTGAIECLKGNAKAESEVTNTYSSATFKVYKAADKKEEASGVGVKLDGKKITLTFTPKLDKKTTVYIAVTDGTMLESNAVGFEVDLYKPSPNCKILGVTATAKDVDIKATIGSGDGKEIGSAIPVTFPIAKENAEQVAVSLKLDSKTSIVNYKSSAAEITTIGGSESPEKVQDDETDVADFKGAFDFTGDSKYLYVQALTSHGPARALTH